MRLAALGKGDPGAHLRPTADRVRESLFNILTHGGHGDPVTGTRVLDLFAGTGALGLEALSRGAVQVTFVETGAKGAALIRENVEKCRAEGQTALIRRDATRLGACPGAPFDLVFLDPPYGKGLGERALASALAGGWIAPGALIVWEEGAAVAPPDGTEVLDSRRHGETMVTILRRG
nr:16S rRNA (guanine(966)-N(2))-methyltransferase RsmD [Rhodovulum strictum]